MPTAVASAIGFVLLAVTVLIHYDVLKFTTFVVSRMRSPSRPRILVAMTGVFVAHVLEIGLYAVVFYVMLGYPEFGAIAGDFRDVPVDLIYYSATCYTTLGVGDIVAQGPMRIVAGVEALNGFVLIGWSASYTYLEMQKHWTVE